MTSAVKSQKDKPNASLPKLAPRPTAASTARAARNATNRNLNLPTCKRVSPSRSLPPSKAKCSPARTTPLQKTNSKPDIKAAHMEFEDNVKDTTLIISETSEERIVIHDEYTTEETVKDIKDVIDSVEDNKKTENSSRIPITIGQTSLVSRPETPMSIGSRPQTPNSRPTTPATIQHVNLHSSRPNTPQRAAARPRTPSSIPSPTLMRTHTPSSITGRISSNKNAEEDVNTTYIAKLQEYNKMKMELDLKQQAVLEVYESLRTIRDRVSLEGGSGGGEAVQELVMFNVADWATNEVAQLCHEINKTEEASELINITLPIDEGVLTELDTRVMDVSSCFADLCLQAFTARQELIDWVKELIENNETGDGDPLDRIARYNAQGLELCEALRDLKNRANFAVDTVTQLSKRTCRERSALISAGETLVRQVAQLRHDLESRNELLNEMKAITTDNNTAKELEVLRRELEEEKNSKAVLKDKLSTTESQLRQTRLRVSKMDKQLREAEASITSLTSTVKTLEDQSRQKEVHLEARARKLKESLKTGEVASNQLVQQRDILLEQVQSLKDEIEKLNNQNDLTVKEFIKEIKELKVALEHEKRETSRIAEQKQIAESNAIETQNSLDELKKKITSLENSRPNPELPTEREMDLWAELQAVKETLRMTEDEVTSCKRDKLRFLESLTKLTESENKMGIQQKLAAELLSKEEIFSKMQSQIRELTKNIKLNEQKVLQYEQYVRTLQAHNRAIANCQETPNGISYQDLQQEIMNLRMGLLEAVHRNDELSEMLVQKEQQIEQQDKTSRAQARVIKVREELINMLKNKESEQSHELMALQQDLERRMKIVEDVNKQIAAKAEEIQELFTTLENKQQQIHRLEKIVLALEEQQRRAQAQRTRHEEKIAALEHELAAGGNRRERLI